MGSHCATFSCDGKYIVSGSPSEVRIWDAQTGKSALGPLKHLSHDTKYLWVTIISPVTTSHIRIVSLLPAAIRVLFGEKATQLCVDFSPDSKRVLSTSWDKTIQVYTLEC